MHGLLIFQNHAHIQNLERSLGECMLTEMSKFATQRQESPSIPVPVKRSFLWNQRHLATLLTSLQMLSICFILCKQANLIEEKRSRIERFIEMCSVATNRLKC